MKFEAIITILSAWTLGALAREAFPVLKVEDYTFAELEPWITGLAVYTMGLGIGLWVLIHLFISGFCIYCCCCAARAAKKRVEASETPVRTLERANTSFLNNLEDQMSQDTEMKGLWMGGFLLTLAMCGCAFAVYSYNVQMDDDVNTFYDGLQQVALDSAIFLCSDQETVEDDDARKMQCSQNSIGDFLYDGIDVATTNFGIVSDFVYGADDRLQPYVTNASDTATRIIAVADDVILQSNYINTNISDINARIVDMVAAQNAQVNYGFAKLGGSYSPDIDLSTYIPVIPLLDSSYFDSINDAINSTNQATVEMNQLLTDVLDLLEVSLKNSSDQAFAQINQSMDDILINGERVKNDIIAISLDMETYQDDAHQYINYKTLGITLLYFIPVIFQSIGLVWAYCTKGHAGLYCDMCLIYTTCLYFCLGAGFVMLFAYLNHDICTVHKAMLEVNLEGQNITLTDTAMDTFTAIDNVMNCGQSGYSDNFVDVLDMGAAFNVSDEVDDLIADIQDSSDELLVGPLDQLNNASDALNDLSTIIATDVSSLVNFTEYDTYFTDLSNDLPPDSSTYDRMSASPDQSGVDTYYFFDHSAYQTAIDSVNTILQAMVTRPPTPVITPPLTFDTIQLLHLIDVQNDDWNDPEDDTITVNGYTYGANGDDDALRTALAVTDDFTDVLDFTLLRNDEVRGNLTAAQAGMVNVEDCIDKIVVDQQELSDEQTFAIAVVDSTIVELTDISTDAIDLLDIVNNITDFIASAPQYTSCVFMGRFYNDIILGVWCTDIQGDMDNLYVPMIALCLLMLLSFILFSIYGPYLLAAKMSKKNAGNIDEARLSRARAREREVADEEERQRQRGDRSSTRNETNTIVIEMPGNQFQQPVPQPIYQPQPQPQIQDFMMMPYGNPSYNAGSGLLMLSEVTPQFTTRSEGISMSDPEKQTY